MTKKKIETALVVQDRTAPDLSAVVQKLRVGPETKKTYKFAMNSFKNYCATNNVSADLTSLIQWLESVKSPSTQSTYIAAVKKVMSEVYKYDPRLIELKADLDGIRQVKRDFTITESGYLKKEEIDKLIKLAPENIGIMIEFLFWTGLRVSEMINCENSKCRLIENGKKSYYEIRIIGKRSKEAIVYINVKMYKKINQHFNGKTHLFEHNGKQFSREHVTREIARAGLLVGRDISAHILRHSFAVYLRDVRKLPLDKIQKALHHSSMSTTSQYYLFDAANPSEIGII